MNIGVIGCEYAGLVTAGCLAEIGHTVAATDSAWPGDIAP
jgi:UDP-glucose 6-dehydrogenase